MLNRPNMWLDLLTLLIISTLAATATAAEDNDEEEEPAPHKTKAKKLVCCLILGLYKLLLFRSHECK